MANDENQNWKPYTIPYTGSGAVRIRSNAGQGNGQGNPVAGDGWVPSSWLVGPGVAQSPSGKVLSSSGVSGGHAPPNAEPITVHSSGPPLSQEPKGHTKHSAAPGGSRDIKREKANTGSSARNDAEYTYDLNPNMNLPPGTISLPPRHAKCPATLRREGEEIRKSCSGEGSSQHRR